MCPETVCKGFKGVSWAFHKCFIGVSQVSHLCFKNVLCLFQAFLKGVLGMQMGMSRMFYALLKDI